MTPNQLKTELKRLVLVVDAIHLPYVIDQLIERYEREREHERA